MFDKKKCIKQSKTLLSQCYIMDHAH
jgi:hypothetical protein